MTQPPRTPFRPAASRRTDAVAVALGYDPDSGRAPTVLATGRGTVAEQILTIAFAEGVKVREDADLAQLLAVLEVDSEIPVEAMAAVAEILSYLYRANGRLAAGGAEGASPPARRRQGRLSCRVGLRGRLCGGPPTGAARVTTREEGSHDGRARVGCG